MLKKEFPPLILCFFLSSLFCSLYVCYFIYPSIAANKTNIPKTHVVKKGDTLWDISSKYLKDPFRWPQIWAKNKYIKNPHWIYPGDIIRLKEEIVQQQARKKVSTVAPTKKRKKKKRKVKKGLVAREKKVIPQKEVTWLASKGAKKHFLAPQGVIESCGYVLPPSEIIGDFIVDAETEKIGLNLNDMIFINLGVRDGILPGEEYTIFRDNGEVIHPLTNEIFGNLIKIIGRAKTIKVLEDISIAIISKSFCEAFVHDMIKPYESFPLPEEIVPGNRYLEAYILASKDDKISLSQTDIIYIDLGEQDGIVPGNVFDIFKSWDIKLDLRGGHLYPYDHRIGSLTILLTKNYSSTGMITYSSEPIEIGDLLKLK